MFSLAQIHPPRLIPAILVFCLVSTLSCCKKAGHQQSSTGGGIEGTLYIRQAQEVGYEALDGDVLELTCDFVRVDVANHAPTRKDRLLFTRDVVQKIQLTNPGDADQGLATLFSRWEKTIDRCWNRPKSMWVAGVQGVPFIGKLLSFLDILPPGFGVFMAITILAIYGLYGGFRFYGVLRQQVYSGALGRIKLEREIAKLDCEITALRQQLGLPGPPISTAPPAARPAPRETPAPTDQPAIHISDFLWHTLLRVPRQPEIEKRREKLQDQWAAKRGNSLRITYWSRLSLNWIVFALVVIFGLGFFSDTFLVLTPAFAPDLTSGERLWFSFSCFVFAVGCVSFSLKLRVRRQILHHAYHHVRAELAKKTAVPVG